MLTSALSLTTLGLILGSALGGFLHNAEIFSLLSGSYTHGYYVVNPTHFLPASAFRQNFLPVAIIPNSNTRENEDSGIKAPKDEYGPPKSDSFPQRDSYRPRPPYSNNNRPPKDEYGPPKFDSFPQRDLYRPRPPYSNNNRPPKDEYGPPKSDSFPQRDSYRPRPPSSNNNRLPTDEYGPPKSDNGSPNAEYGPPAAPQETVIFNSYIEPTYSFGEIPLTPIAFTNVDSSRISSDKKERRKETRH